MIPTYSTACYAIMMIFQISIVDTFLDNLLCILSLSNKIWDSFGVKF